MRCLRWLLVFGVAVLGLGVGITLLALEGSEVVIVRTSDGHGTVRETRIWIADEAGFAWIEAANPAREFYRHILQNPEVELRRGGTVGAYHAVPITMPEGHARIRRLLAQKYGWADWWIGLLADTSHSVAIRLEPR